MDCTNMNERSSQNTKEVYRSVILPEIRATRLVQKRITKLTNHEEANQTKIYPGVQSPGGA